MMVVRHEMLPGNFRSLEGERHDQEEWFSTTRTGNRIRVEEVTRI
jgi:hypothetical protein